MDLKALRRTITSMFRAFSMDPHGSPLRKQKDREIAGRFIDRIYSTEFDTGELPYYSKDGTAKGANKAECVFAMMSLIVQTYWLLSMFKPPEDPGKLMIKLDDELKKLETVYQQYDRLSLIGDEKGYCLLKSYRKDLYEQKEKESVPAEDGTEEINEKLDGRSEGKPESEGEVKQRCYSCEGSGLEHDENGCEIDDVCNTCGGSGLAVREDE